MRFQFNHMTHNAEIKFDGPPSPDVRGFLKDNGWRFDEDVATEAEICPAGWEYVGGSGWNAVCLLP